MAKYVVLNGVRYEIEGYVQERQVSPWAGKISMGSQNFADFQPCSVREYADLTGGIGLDKEIQESNRVSWSESIETTKAGEVTLGPLATTAGNFNAVPLKIIEFDGYMHALANSKSEYYNTSNSTWTEADASPLTTPTDALVVTDATDTYLVVCNGSDVRYATDKTTWAALSTSDIKYLTTLDKRLIGVNASGNTIYYSTRDNIDDAAGGAMNSFNISGEWTACYDVWNGKLVTTDEDAIYMLTDTGLVVVDFWTRCPYKMEVRYQRTSNALVGMYWNSEVFCGVGSSIFKISPNLVSQFGPDADDGLPSEHAGYIYDMIGLSHWMVICVSGGTSSSILKRHESLGGWHEVYSTATNNIRCLAWSTIPSAAGGALWFQDGSNIKYVTFADKTHDVTKVSGYTYAASGDFVLPKLTKVSVIPKTAVAIEALTEGCSATETITVYMRTDATTSWGTAVGAFNANGHPTKISLNSYLGTAFNDIQLKVALARGDTTTKSPKLKSLALLYIPNPTVVSSWAFNIKAAGDETKTIIDNLTTARDSTTLVTFSPVGDLTVSTKYVRVESIPSIQDLEGYAAEKIFQVKVTEVE